MIKSKSNTNESCNTYTEVVKNNVSEYGRKSCGSWKLERLKPCDSEKFREVIILWLREVGEVNKTLKNERYSLILNNPYC